MKVLAFFHPALGAMVVLGVLWLMSRGLVARRGGSGAHAARKAHRLWGPRVHAAMMLAALTGLASTLWLRDDLSAGETWHLVVGLTALTLMTVAAILSRLFKRYPVARNIHPLIGMLVVFFALWQAVLGIELLP